MKTLLVIGSLAAFLLATLPAPAQEKKEAKKKAEKVSGDVGLLDLEKNYMILVTKEGKLITLDFNQKTKAVLLKEDAGKMSDISLGSSASVEYTEKGEKKSLTAIEFSPAKGGE
ncbi:MAG: hypothetical protein ACREQW_13725 [Candidatus Binatia bacterium]